MNPVVSIITVTYQAATTLPATIESLRSQRGAVPGTDFEWIVQDGASTDGTPEMALAGGIPCVSVVSDRDSGIYDAMNRGLRRAQGDYVMFLNAGDSLHDSDTLAAIVKAIREADVKPGVVYGQTDIVDAERRYIGPRHLTAPERLTFKSFAEGMLVCHQAFIARRDLAPEYDTSLRLSADYEWCLRILKKSDFNLYMPRTIIDYLNQGMTTANRKASLKERYRVMCHYYGTVPTVLRHLKFAPRFIINRLRHPDT